MRTRVIWEGDGTISVSLDLDDAAIRKNASEESFQRGRDYCEQGAVGAVTLRGRQLLAEVQGSRYEPYRVEVTLSAGAILNAHCSCPYDWGGYCKHIVATLLTCINERDRIDERPTIGAVLAELDRDQLQALVSTLAERQPDLVKLDREPRHGPEDPAGGDGTRPAAIP